MNALQIVKAVTNGLRVNPEIADAARRLLDTDRETAIYQGRAEGGTAWRVGTQPLFIVPSPF
jgi:hypothetical protein